MTNGPKVVWILGAGFSKPLGGPLLGQLLTPGSFQDIRARYGKEHALVSPAAQFACHVYHYGRAYEEGCLVERKLPGERLWADAEEFLDMLDAAAESKGSLARPTIERILLAVCTHYRGSLPPGSSDVGQMRDAARRLLAAECSDFANRASLGVDHDASVVPERWSAHVDWMKQLNSRHTIVTFNYDRALERMGRHLRKEPQPDDGPLVMLPGAVSDEKKIAQQVRLLKLHGSVDWRRTLDGISRVRDDFALEGPCEELVIATPGPTKSKVTEALEPLWVTAEAEIKAADVVAFVGYRFPPTDATARRRILGAIEKRALNRDRALLLHVVLGPQSPDTPRLVELLRFAAQHGELKREDARIGEIENGCFRIRTHQLNSQDFFTVYREAILMR
jgi:hypothetical protein